jgi:choline dehydrogenase-like flavoprotein
VGGGTVTYGSSSWRHLPYEFNEASYDQTIPSGTGMADWPVTYDELEPYYTQAEWEMGISGLRVNSPFLAPMTKDYPVPPVPLKSSGALLNSAAAKLGLTSVPGPLAIITKPYMGREACVNCESVPATAVRCARDPAQRSRCCRSPKRPGAVKFG